MNFSDIQLIVYDFDGVITDNRVMVSEDGMESVIVSRADGLGVNIIKEMEIPQMILSTETNPVVSLRAKKLGIPVLQGVDDKMTVLLNYCKSNNFHFHTKIWHLATSWAILVAPFWGPALDS